MGKVYISAPLLNLCEVGKFGAVVHGYGLKDLLLVKIAMSRGDGTYREHMKRLKKVKLLILNDWLLYPLKENEARDALELVKSRSKVSSTIFCFQFDVLGSIRPNAGRRHLRPDHL